jgi:hypothetical protein
VGQIGLPFVDERGGSISVLGWSLPLQADSIIVASLTPALSLGGALNLRIEEIAPSEAKAASQTASLNLLLMMARGIAVPLADDPANISFKELLKTAVVNQERDRVVLTATVSRSIFTTTAAAQPGNSVPQ